MELEEAAIGTIKAYESDPETDSLSDQVPPLTKPDIFLPACASISTTERRIRFNDEADLLSEATNVTLEKTLSMTNRFDPVDDFEDSVNQSVRTPSTSRAFIASTSFASTSSKIPYVNNSVSENPLPENYMLYNTPPQFQNSSIYRNYAQNYQALQANEIQAAVVQAQQSNISDQLQKSIFSQPTIHSQYRLLVSDTSSPEIISPTSSNAVTVTADVHATESGVPDINIDRSAIFSTFSANLEPETTETPGEELVDSTPVTPTLNRLIKTDGLQGEPMEPDSTNISTDEEDNLAAKLLQRKSVTKSGVGETLLFGFRGSQKLLRIQEPVLTKNEESQENLFSLPSTAPSTPQIEPKITPKPKKHRRWATKHGLPPQFEIFETIDTILIEEANRDAKNLVAATPKERVYAFKNRAGQILLYGVEHPTFCPIGICPSGRPFEMILYDPAGVRVMSLLRKTSCLAGCLIPCLWQQLNVYCPLHVYLGCIEEDVTFCIPKFTVFNNFNVGVFTLRGPIGASVCNNGIDFLLYKRGDYTDVGCITDNWIEDGDLYNHNVYGIKFPIDLAVKIKLLLLSAAVLIKYVYYEKKTKVVFDTPPEGMPEPDKRLNVFGYPEEPISEGNSVAPIVEQPKFDEHEDTEFVRLPPIRDDSDVSIGLTQKEIESDNSQKELSDVTYEDMVVDSNTSVNPSTEEPV